jgi:cysteinyl-tRNA synthetase
VVGEGGAAPDGVRVAVAPVGTPDIPQGADPAEVRLALLTAPRSTPAPLDGTALTEAHDTLVRWRRAVADWARHPSRPVPDEVRGRLRTAWEDDLDVPEVLRVLRWVEESDLPEGARFETYAYADRLLGLELTRDLGAPA